MSAVEDLSAALRRRFCAELDVSPVPMGYAVSTGFMMPDGDPLSFYIVPGDDGRFVLEDDGTVLPTAMASGLDLKSPVREQLLRGILAEEGVRFDSDLAMRTAPVEGSQLGPTAMRFVSALIRMRDLALLSRENVAASFADDVKRALAPKLPPDLAIDEPEPGSASADLVLRRPSNGLKAARIYAAGSDLRMMDALVEHQARRRGESPVIAVVDRRRGRVSETRFNVATNRGLLMAVVDGVDDDWTSRVIDLAAAAANDPDSLPAQAS